jgi:hypothetical protein
MESQPVGWHISAKGNYLCPCGTFNTDDLKDIPSHFSLELGEGYCVRGIRSNSEHRYECICGDQFIEKKGWETTYDQAFGHVWKQLNGLGIGKCVTKFRNKCQKCNKQLDSPQALRIHCQSNSHINFESKVDLYCKVCDIRYYGQKQMLTHLATNKHKKRASIIPAENNEGSEEP